MKGSGFPRLKELVAYYKSERLMAAKLTPSLADTPITVLGTIFAERAFTFSKVEKSLLFSF